MEKKYEDMFLSYLEQLVNIPSPSGFTAGCRDFLLQEIKKIDCGGEIRVFRNNGIELSLAPEQIEKIGFAAHYDTLGLMVREIEKDGTIRLVKIGGYPWSAAEGESVTVHAAGHKNYRGTVLFHKASTHVYGSEYEKDPRTDENMYLRLDEKVSSRSDVYNLGIQTGDFVSFDVRFETSQSGFIKSRHLDDKVGCALLLSLLRWIFDSGIKPSLNWSFSFTAAEEIGKGATFIENLQELLIVDNAVIGKGQNSCEDKVTICVKDSTGPFHYEFRRELEEICREKNIDFVLDIYRFYGSDSETVLKKGVDARTALIGPGIDASHSFERTHLDSVRACFNLMREWFVKRNSGCSGV